MSESGESHSDVSDFEWDAALGLKATTASRYEKGVTDYENFCLSKGFTIEWERPSKDDELMVSFLEKKKEDGTKRVNGRVTYIGSAPWYLISACKAKNPNFASPFAERYLKSWSREHSQYSAVAKPLTDLQVRSLVSVLILEGRIESAILASLQYSCLLRVSECLKVQESSFFTSENHTLCVRLTATKTRDCDVVPVPEGFWTDLINKLREMLRKNRRHGYLTTISRVAYCTQLRKAYEKLEIEEVVRENGVRACRFSSHSFRRSMATHMMSVENINLKIIQLRGRWASYESLDRYLLEGLALRSVSKDPRGLQFLSERLREFVY